MKRICPMGVVLGLTLSFAVWSPLQRTASAQEKKAAAPTASDTGKILYGEYCASCHGKLAKGDGPAATEFKVPPADLTTIAKRNGGKFPADHVASVLRFGATAPAHGTSEMPVWGGILGTSPTHGTDQVKVQQRILALTNYIESLQVK